MSESKRNDFSDLGTNDKEEFKIVDLEPEQDVEKMPDGFDLVPITRPSPHEGNPPILSGYALKRPRLPERGEILECDREGKVIEVLYSFCGNSMHWENLLWKVNGLFDTEAYAIKMANWQIEQEKKYAEQKKETKPIHLVKTTMPYVNAGGDVEKATKINVQLTKEETITLENLKQAAKQTHAVIGLDKPVQTNADVIRLILQALKARMTF